MENSSSEPKKKNIIESLVPAILVVTVGLAFLVGILWQKVQNLESGKVATTANTTTTTGTQPQTPTVSLDTIKGLFDKDLMKFGDNKRKNLLVEAADPSCPYCHVAGGYNPELAAQIGETFKYKSQGGSYVPAVPEMKKLVDKGDASYVYIYTPGHGNGEMGAKALYCAYEQNKFWEVHDLLMNNKGYDLLNNVVKNDKTKSQDLADFLKGAANATQLKSCLDSGKYDARLASDTALARELGSPGTPGFFVNDKFFNGAYSWTDMSSSVK
jgi:protein-disulfide isomerase